MPFSLGSAALAASLMAALPGGLGSTAQASPSGAPFRVKVFLFTRATQVELDESGMATPRRGGLEPSQLESIQAAIRSFSGALSSATGGPSRVLLDVEEDPEQVASFLTAGEKRGSEADLAIRLGSAASGSAWSQLLASGIGGKINSAEFEANDRVYRGPYGLIFLIHAGLDGFDRDFTFDGTPGRAIGWHTFSQESPQEALVGAMMAKAGQVIPGLTVLAPRAPAVPYPSGFGEVEVTASGSSVRLVSTGIVARGGARLMAIKPGSGPFLTFRARSSTREPMALNLVGPNGPVASILLKGSRPGDESRLLAPFDSSGAQIEAGSDWTSFALDLRQVPNWSEASELQMGTPLSVTRFEKGPPEHSILEVSDLALAPAAEGALTLKQPLPTPAETELRAFIQRLRSSEPLTPGDWTKAAELASKGDARERLSVLSAFLVRKDPKAVPILVASATSAQIADAFVASRALAAQGLPEARAALSETLVKGPFESNRRFAAEAMTEPTAADLPLLSMMMVQRGWRSRLAAVEAISRVKTREAQVILLTSLAAEAEPHPLVRLAISSRLDPSFELASRRLLLSALNDPSNCVRAASVTKLLDSPFEAIRAEAASSRDDAAPVRRALLEAMAAKPSPSYRTSIRQMVVDQDSSVRAAALGALGSLEGPVQPAEVENTFADSDEGVQLALVALAKKGKLSLPPNVLASLKASRHSAVRTAAQGLGGAQQQNQG